MNIPEWINSNYTRYQMYAQIKELKQFDGEPISTWETLRIIGLTIAAWALLSLMIIALT